MNQFTENWLCVKARHVSDVLEHVKARSLLLGEVEPPTWLGKGADQFEAQECLATKGSIIHLPSLVSRIDPNTVAATPAFFTTNATDFDLDLNAPRPETWLSFLGELWCDDPQCIETLQEIFGYLLTSDTRQQKIFLLVGPKRSGKGTIARVLTSVVGRGNIAAPTLAGLSTNFGLWPLIGKSVAIISDARLSGRADQVVVVERLLSISGEDAVTIDRKCLRPITCKLPTRFVILTELPRLSDASGAIVSRMILLHTTRSFYGREDKDLTERILKERPGILLWAIQGWQRLRERGRFVQPDSAVESLEDMNELASPVAAFVEDRCVVSAAATVAVANLFGSWQTWCEEHGRGKFAGNVQTFGRDLLAAYPSVKRGRIREDGDRTRVYYGIGLRNGY